jgi:23S rRNA (uracil1939-C5)-methyltransferase
VAETVELSIESLAAGGDGVAHTETGKVVFVPRTVPGDRVRAELTGERTSFARGRLLEVLESGPARREPGCPLFVDGRCGGCQWLHVELETQRAAKSEIVRGALRRALAAGLELEPMDVAGPALGWRRRARLHWFRPKKSERAIVGFTEPRSHRIAAVEACVQLAPELAAALAPIQRELAPGLHKKGEIDLLAGAEGVLVGVRGPVNRRHLEALAADPAIAGVRGRGVVLGAAAVEIDRSPQAHPIGGPLVGEIDRSPKAHRGGGSRMGELDAGDEAGTWARAGDFAQASEAGNRALLEAVIEYAAKPQRVLELFAGQGNLTRALAPIAGEVVAVERRGGPRWRHPSVAWRRGEAAAVVAELAEAGEKFDLVVLDPPRRGAVDVIEPLLALRPDRIVYVSCDPATLARDVDALAAAYRPMRGRPLDLMPQTSQVEVVIELARRS